MGYLNDDDFEDIPEDDGEAFTHLEAISRSRLLGSRPDNDNLALEELLDYMNEVCALAAHFDVPDIFMDNDIHNVGDRYSDFTRRVEYRTVQIRAARSRRNKRNSVAISGPGRERIQHYVERLKAEIEAASIPEKRKQALLNKIAEFEAELAKKRFNLAQAMMVIALVAASGNDLADAADRVWSLAHSISDVLGKEKEHEEEQQRMLPPREPFKAIPDFRQAANHTARPLATGQQWFAANPEDGDIPF